MADMHTYQISYDIPEFLDKEKKNKNQLTGQNILTTLYLYGGLDLNPENGFILYDYKNQVLKQNIIVQRPVKSTWFFHSPKSLNEISIALSVYDGMLFYVLTEVKELYPVFSKMLYKESLQTEIDEWVRKLENIEEEKPEINEMVLMGVGGINQNLRRMQELTHKIEARPKKSILYDLKKN